MNLREAILHEFNQPKYIQCVIPGNKIPDIPIIDSHCQYHYTGGLQCWYTFEDTVTNRSALQNAGVYTFFPGGRGTSTHITMLYNDPDYNVVKDSCKCNKCHTRHKDYKLYNFFKVD